MTDQPLNQETMDALLRQASEEEPQDGPPAADAPPAAAAPVVGAASHPSAAVRPVVFSPLPTAVPSAGVSSIDLLLDVPLQVTAELGRTSLSVRDVLGMGAGSVVELDRLAGEPVDLLVNNLLIARGEVVVIDESFGVRVTEIVRRAEEKATGRARRESA